MDHFLYKDGQLFADNVPVAKIAAEVGTPTYIYSKATLLTHYQRIARDTYGDVASFRRPLSATQTYGY